MRPESAAVDIDVVSSRLLLPLREFQQNRRVLDSIASRTSGLELLINSPMTSKASPP